MPEIITKDKHYLLDGEEFPRVTSILNNLPKPFLVPWAAREAAAYAVERRSDWLDLPHGEAIDTIKNRWKDYRDERAEHGTNVHAYAEWYFGAGEMPELTDGEDEAVAGFLAWAERYKPQPLYTELTVVSFGRNPWTRGVRYIGTLDLLAGFDTDRYPKSQREAAGMGIEHLLVDYKTSKSVYPSHAVQLAAYAGAEFMATNVERDEEGNITSCDLAPMPQIDGARVLLINPKFPKGYMFYPVEIGPTAMRILEAADVIGRTYSKKGLVGKALR